MYRMLVVDDEKSHRSGLSKLLYSMYPEDMTLEAENGEQALDILQLLECDIVITDIKMEGLDGISLLRKIKDVYRSVEVIILSGYGHFEYAQDAIRHGAMEYLLKPVDSEELRMCMDRVRKHIQDRRSNENDRITMRQELEETEPIYLDYLMWQFVTNPHFNKAEKLQDLLHIDRPGWLFLCSVDYLQPSLLEQNGQSFKLLLHEYLKPFSSYAFPSKEDGVFVIIVFSETRVDRSCFEQFAKKMEEASIHIGDICVSEPQQNMLYDANLAFNQVSELWKYRFYGADQIYDYKYWKDYMFGASPNLSGITTFICEKIKQNDITKAFNKIRDCFAPAQDGRYPDPGQLLRNITFMLFQVVKEIEPMMSEGFKQDTESLFTDIQKSQKATQLQKELYSYLVRLGKDVNYQKETKGITVLEHCKEYLENHFKDEITLEEIAAKYYFTASYFSTIFHNHFGKSFTNYMIDLRMRKASGYLLDTEKKVREIASMVGYRDPNYFIRAFKKHYGCTPEEYRKLKAQD